VRPRGVVALAVVLAAAGLGAAACRGRADRKTPEEIRQEIAALEQERDALRARMGELLSRDPRLAGMPDEPLRIGVPTVLAADLIQKVATGFVDQVTLELKNIKVKKRGTVKKVITIGSYDLRVLINQVSGKLETGEPQVRFGGNRVSLDLPVRVASGTGTATIDFKWDGKNVSGAVCGDMDVHQVVTGSVVPADYPVRGALQLSATTDQILASPKFPKVRVNLKVKPSEESWAAVQKLLESKEGICGFVVDKVNIGNILLGLLERGFNVRLPTEKIKPIAVPVGIQPTIDVKGRTVHLALDVGHLQITEHMIWLGANVGVKIEDEKPPGS
jgi:hypothetical protein